MGLLISIVFFAFVFLFVKQIALVIPENKRAAVYRLGRFQGVMGPGLIVVIPFIDKVIRIDLEKNVPGWKGMAPREINAKVKDFALTNFG